MTENLGAAGHRGRLKERFLKAGLEGIADYELLELVLFLALPRGDVKPLAKELLAYFGTFAGVLSADAAALSKFKGIGNSAFTVFKIIHGATRAFTRDEVMHKPILGSWQKILDYCKVTMGHKGQEEFRLLFVDNKNILIAEECQQRGTVNHTPVYPREVVKRALEVGATALIMVHNHPSGDATPSKADIAMTKDIVKACESVGVLVHDHLIITKNEHTSFKSLGLI